MIQSDPVAAAQQPVVIIEAGEPMADSRNVAAYFQKQHKDVLRAIRSLHCSDAFRQRNFAPCFINDLTGTTTSHYLMTKDGFVFTALGFTGQKAGEFKEAYVARFNAMEAELRKPDPLAVLSDPAQLRTLLLGYAEREMALQQKVGQLAPKAEALERLSEARGSLCISDAAKALQMGPRALFAFLRGNGWIFRRPNSTQDRGFQDKVRAGLLEHKMTEPDDRGWTWEQVRVTPRGLARLAQLLDLPAPPGAPAPQLPPPPSYPPGGA